MRVNGSVDVVGVYSVPENKEVSLVEMLVHARPSDIDVSRFTQEAPSQPRDNWQVAYDEHYLNGEGDSLLGDFLSPPEDDRARTRLTFYFYFLDPLRPLITPFGEVRLPKRVPMPDCLRRITRFEEAD